MILDDRIVSSSYGSQFLDSLPPAHFTRDITALRSVFGEKATT